jgi:Kef-type K+ transport system membrane component KefB
VGTRQDVIDVYCGDRAVELISILFILAAVWTVGLLFKRINQPPILGELLAGIVIGPPVLNLVEFSPTIELLAKLGMFFLMFYAELQTKMPKLFWAFKATHKLASVEQLLPYCLGWESLFFWR